MRLRISVLAFIVGICQIAAQNAPLPLESVAIEGTTIPRAAVLEIGALRIGAPIDKAGIEQACKNLEESGIFASIGYKYAPGPKKGYALTLTLADQAPLGDAVIDVPGADEDEVWKWLISKYQRFDHRVPQAGAAQQFLSHQIEQHLAGALRNQPVVARLETDLKTHKTTISFQPETLPRIQSVTYSSNRMITSLELNAVLGPIVSNEGYTDRKFAGLVDLNLRPLYEQRGLYRVRFLRVEPKFSEAAVSVNVAIEEGEPYQLGKVEIIGDNLPVEAMLAAASFPKGKVANWKDIQAGIWNMEKVVRRTGFLNATAIPERVFDDSAHVLDLRIPIAKGPLYHYGDVKMSGLSAELQERARRLWRPKSGDPYDYGYPSEFFQAFSRTTDFRVFRKYEAVTVKGNGDHVMDINLVFTLR